MRNGEDLIEVGQRLLSQGRILSTKLLFEEGMRRTPHFGPAVCYNLGWLHESAVGDGTEARRLYNAAIDSLPDCRARIPDRGQRLEANACENMMFFSLSYDEYDGWADRVATLQPDNLIHVVQRRDVHEMKEEGRPWRDVLQWMGNSFFDFIQPAQSANLPGKAAAVFQMMLDNRDRLRIPNDTARNLTGVYSALILKLLAAHGATMARTLGSANAAEIRFIAEKAIPRVEECLRQYPNESRIQEMLRHLQRAAREPGRDVDPVKEADRAIGCGLFTAAAVAAGLLVSWLL